jgi:hypothetical protein
VRGRASWRTCRKPLAQPADGDGAPLPAVGRRDLATVELLGEGVVGQPGKLGQNRPQRLGAGDRLALDLERTWPQADDSISLSSWIGRGS